MIFSAITKNLNWEILAKNLATFKTWHGIKDEKFYHYVGSLKYLIRGGVTKNQYIDRKYLKKGGGLGQFADLRGGAWRKRGGVFDGGGLIPNAHYG